MTAFLALIGGFKGAAIIVLIVLFGGYLTVQHSKLTKAQTERKEAILQLENTKVQLDRAINAARANQEVIVKLQDERETANKALSDLQSARNKNKTNTITREVIIEKQSKLPPNIAPAAPVVNDIIREVQSDRKRRRGDNVTKEPTK